VSQTEMERRRDAEAQIRATMMNELCGIMHKLGLPPMMVLHLAARSIGTIYREMADVHSGIDPCSCGWRPHPLTDVEVLGMALMTACEQRRTNDLLQMRVIGTA